MASSTSTETPLRRRTPSSAAAAPRALQPRSNRWGGGLLQRRVRPDPYSWLLARWRRPPPPRPPLLLHTLVGREVVAGRRVRLEGPRARSPDRPTLGVRVALDPVDGPHR